MARFINSPHRDRDVRREGEHSPREAKGRDDEEEDDDRDNPDAQDGRDQCPKSRPAKFSGARAIQYARQYLEEVIGQIPESVSGLTRSDGGWKVTLDVVELERVPRSTDVLASYEVELDEDGELIGYHRIGRFYRNQVDER